MNILIETFGPPTSVLSTLTDSRSPESHAYVSVPSLSTQAWLFLVMHWTEASRADLGTMKPMSAVPWKVLHHLTSAWSSAEHHWHRLK